MRDVVQEASLGLRHGERLNPNQTGGDLTTFAFDARTNHASGGDRIGLGRSKRHARLESAHRCGRRRNVKVVGETRKDDRDNERDQTNLHGVTWDPGTGSADRIPADGSATGAGGSSSIAYASRGPSCSVDVRDES